MFCKQCGAEIKLSDKFCQKCGSKVDNDMGLDVNIVEDDIASNNINNVISNSTSNDKSIDKNSILFSVKPTYNVFKQSLVVIGKVFVGALFVVYFLSEILFYIPFLILLFLAVMIIAFIVMLIFRKIEFKHLEYKFYIDRMEYEDGFLNKSKKQVKYSSIREIILHRTVIDRFFNLGRIRIATSAEINRSKYRSGLNLTDLVDSEYIYEKVKEITGE